MEPKEGSIRLAIGGWGLVGLSPYPVGSGAVSRQTGSELNSLLGGVKKTYTSDLVSESDPGMSFF